MNTEVAYEVPVPSDLLKISGIHDGKMWILGIVKGSVSASNGTLTFSTSYRGTRRSFALATDIIAGYQCDE
jgi:hypothetical protein